MTLRPTCHANPTQRGATAVEFSFVCIILFTFLFSAMEVARALYLWSTAAEVVARAARLAAVTSPQDMAAVRKQAMFRNSANKLLLGGDIDETYLRIDYVATSGDPVSPLPTPMENMLHCASSPIADNCVRFVRVRLCMPGTDCTPVPYKPMVGLDLLKKFNMQLPTFATVVAADSLGLAGGAP